jgi:hypothetical protein
MRRAALAATKQRTLLSVYFGSVEPSVRAEQTEQGVKETQHQFISERSLPTSWRLTGKLTRSHLDEGVVFLQKPHVEFPFSRRSILVPSGLSFVQAGQNPYTFLRAFIGPQKAQPVDTGSGHRNLRDPL